MLPCSIDGFRKVKSQSLDHAEWWEFRHPQFLRDEPGLLSEIKRSVHFSKLLLVVARMYGSTDKFLLFRCVLQRNLTMDRK
jgi:hypothetical protein